MARRCLRNPGRFNPDEREYYDAADQIREVLIHGNNLSQKDIEFSPTTKTTASLSGFETCCQMNLQAILLQ
jgi:hypothetical protein